HRAAVLERSSRLGWKRDPLHRYVLGEAQAERTAEGGSVVVLASTGHAETFDLREATALGESLGRHALAAPRRERGLQSDPCRRRPSEPRPTREVAAQLQLHALDSRTGQCHARKTLASGSPQLRGAGGLMSDAIFIGP